MACLRQITVILALLSLAICSLESTCDAAHFHDATEQSQLALASLDDDACDHCPFCTGGLSTVVLTASPIAPVEITRFLVPDPAAAPGVHLPAFHPPRS